MTVDSSALAAAIRDALDARFRPGLVALLGAQRPDSKILRDAEAAWAQLAAAIAAGVADYLFRDPAAKPADLCYVTGVSSAADDKVFWDWVTDVAAATHTQAPVSLCAVLRQPTRPAHRES